MTSRVLALVLVVALAGCGGATQPPATTAAHAAALPASGQLVDPGSAAPYVVADRLRGKVVVLDFWASWCDDCRRTVPQVVRLDTGYRRTGLVVIGVNAGEAAADAKRAAAEFGIEYDIALDPELAFSNAVGAVALPTLLVIDRDGRIVHRAAHVDEDTLAVIRSLLGVAP
jgi:thiol-disulfide isomerase/thioredoxin